MDLVQKMPEDWKFDVDLISGGEKDRFGDPTPETTIRVSGCLMSINETSDLDNLNANPTLRGTLFMPKGVKVPSTARIVTHDPAPIAGDWTVDGEAIYWPLGTEIRLSRSSDV